MTTPQPTNPNAQFPPHDPTAQFSFPKSEEEVVECARSLFAWSSPLR